MAEDKERKERHRQADAKWRASLADCYSTLSRVVPAKERKKKISRIKILENTSQHLEKLEGTLHNLLDMKARQLAAPGPSFDINHYRDHFMRLECYNMCHNFSSLDLYKSVLERESQLHLSQPLPLTALDDNQPGHSRALALQCTPTMSSSVEMGKPGGKCRAKRQPRAQGRSARRCLMESGIPASEKENDEQVVPQHPPFTRLVPMHRQEARGSEGGAGTSYDAFTPEAEPAPLRQHPQDKKVHIVWLKKDGSLPEDQTVPSMATLNSQVAFHDPDDNDFFNLSGFAKWCDNIMLEPEDNQVVPWLDSNFLMDP